MSKLVTDFIKFVIIYKRAKYQIKFISEIAIILSLLCKTTTNIQYKIAYSVWQEMAVLQLFNFALFYTRK